MPQHILRYWETRFPQLKPLQRAGNRRYYRPDDVALAQRIHRLLNQDGYTIRGVQQLLAQGGERRRAARRQPPPAAPTSGHAEHRARFAAASELARASAAALADALADAIALVLVRPELPDRDRAGG